MIDLCKIFGVEEGEEFRIELDNVFLEVKYRIKNNIMEWSEIGTEFEGDYNKTNFSVNDVNRIKNIIKLSKKKEFTDDELCILRNIDKEYKWIARDEDDKGIFVYEFKPTKGSCSCSWINGGDSASIYGFSNLFQSIKWEDEEPVFIDDYVERSVE
jgi:hypothetical protein